MQNIFPEITQELVYFTRALHKEICEQGASNRKVFFLAREGQILKNIFDRMYPYEAYGIETYYMKVSRTSTFLPSLREIESETFDTLFRQYHTISLADFLKNLGMESFGEELISQEAVSLIDYHRKIETFFNSTAFEELVASKKFVTSYELKRQNQKTLLTEYFLQHHHPDKTLNLVDVGWKGTIQDHIHKALDAEKKNIKIQGFYLGLLWPTGLSRTNKKKGILFWCNEQIRSTGLSIFNENRALYEMLLGADHGSASSYRRDTKTGQIEVDLQPFDEELQFKKMIGPLQQELLSKLDISENTTTDLMQFNAVLKSHKRMVFYPTQEEIAFFEKLFQPENFGIFENTHFLAKKTWITGFVGAVKGLLTGDESNFGFWPYAYLHSIFGKAIANIYRWKQLRKSIS